MLTKERINQIESELCDKREIAEMCALMRLGLAVRESCVTAEDIRKTYVSPPPIGVWDTVPPSRVGKMLDALAAALREEPGR